MEALQWLGSTSIDVLAHVGRARLADNRRWVGVPMSLDANHTDQPCTNHSHEPCAATCPVYGGRMCRSQEGLRALWQASRCEKFEGFQHGRSFPEELFHVGRRGRSTVG
jgi:hypothetical protein